jgi:APA family basic amino acid/polyamine antiporter
MTPVLLVALAGAISAMTIAGPRVYFAMARDGFFIRSFSHIHPRFHTPALAIALQTVWSVILVTIGGFEQILMYTGFAVVLSSGVAVVGLFVIVRRHRLARPAVPTIALSVVFAIASFAMVVNAIREAPKTSLAGLVAIAAGIPVFIVSRVQGRARVHEWRAKAVRSESPTPE